MTDLDTTPPVVPSLAGRHPADGRGLEARAEPGPSSGGAVLHLNDAAAIYEALADEIAGSAVGWSADALAQLEQGLLGRYGALIGGRQPVRRLVRLAAGPVDR